MKTLTTRLDNLWPQWRPWIQITRLDKPVGSYLLLWPTFWALWIAAAGTPSLANLIIFTLGVFLMRSAGCVINDFADRKVDGHVKRTSDRPLATGALSSRAALTGFALLCLVAFLLVLLTNRMTILLSFGGVALAFIYPFMKRHTPPCHNCFSALPFRGQSLWRSLLKAPDCLQHSGYCTPPTCAGPSRTTLTMPWSTVTTI